MTRSSLARLALEIVLATFTIWLVVENAVLLFVDPWLREGQAAALAVALAKAGLMLASALWPWPFAALVAAVAFALGLVARALRGEPAKAMRHA